MLANKGRANEARIIYERLMKDRPDLPLLGKISRTYITGISELLLQLD
jgi:hypothetical protein